jgi:hypothetical protein
MKILLSLLVALALSVVGGSLAADEVTPIGDRNITVNFQANLVDNDDLAFDGQVDAEARFYRSPGNNSGDLVYEETFDDVEVGRGILQLSLFGGSPAGGTVFSPESLANEHELYVTISVNGTDFLSSHPLRSSFAAARAEYAAVAEGLRKEIKLTEGELPQHSAQLITSGQLDKDRIGSFDASKITSGTFTADQIPEVPASKVTSGIFSSSLMPTTLNASQFTTGVLEDAVVADEILRSDDIAIDFGFVGHNGYIAVPSGFDRSQCQWVLGLRYIDGSGGLDQFHISWQLTGEVECRWSPREDGQNEQYCTANYLMVCKK